MDELYNALSSPYRREILRLLKQGSMNEGEIANHFEIKPPSVSRHLEVLKLSKLVTAHRQHTHVVYTLNAPVAEKLLKDVSDMLDTDGNEVSV